MGPSFVSENICYWEKYSKLFICLNLIESAEVKMGEKIQLKGGVYKVKFGYHSKMGGYTMLMSDMLELGDIGMFQG